MSTISFSTPNEEERRATFYKAAVAYAKARTMGVEILNDEYFASMRTFDDAFAALKTEPLVWEGFEFDFKRSDGLFLRGSRFGRVHDDMNGILQALNRYELEKVRKP